MTSPVYAAVTNAAQFSVPRRESAPAGSALALVTRLCYYPRLRCLVDHVADNLDRSISLGEAAALCAMNPSAFSRFFSAKTGVGFGEFVRMLRILRAVELLEEQDRSLDEVSRRVGYLSFSTFARNFRTVLGCAPSKYKKHIELAQRRTVARERKLLIEHVQPADRTERKRTA